MYMDETRSENQIGLTNLLAEALSELNIMRLNTEKASSFLDGNFLNVNIHHLFIRRKYVKMFC